MPIANDDLYAQSWNTNFGSNPFDEGISECPQNTEDTEYTPIQIPDDYHPPSPGTSKNSGGSPVEQTTEPNENHENGNPQQSGQDDRNTPKTQKDIGNSSENDIQNTPENSQKIPENPQNTPLQEEPINTRGEKYNLRPNPNPNFSDSYRY